MWAIRLVAKGSAACWGAATAEKNYSTQKLESMPAYELALHESAVLVSLLWNLDNILSYLVKKLGFKPELTDSSPPIFVYNQQ